MDTVRTPDGYGQVLRTESARGRTSYLVKGAGFEGWYDGIQITADFADQPEDIIPNEDNTTTLPYPSRPQGPGWDGSTSTIDPGIDPDIEYGHASDSMTGDSTGEDPVEADIEGLFEPHSRVSRARHELHNTAAEDKNLEVSDIPDESPTGLDNSPINPDGVDTDDLFDGSLPHFERESAVHDRLVIEDDLSFLRYASDDEDSDDEKSEEDSEDDDSDNSESSSSDDEGDSDSGSDSDSDSDGDGGSSDDSGDSHTAAFSLTTTSDLHFLANFCLCATEDMPLHSKSEHREIVAEGGLKNRRKKNKPLGTKPLTGQHGDKNPKTPSEAGYVKSKGVAEAVKKPKSGVKNRKVERPIKYADFDTPPGSGTPNHVTPQPRDLAELEERYTDPQLGYQEPLDLVDHDQDSDDGAGSYNHYSSVQHHSDGYDKYIGGSDGSFYLIASGDGKLPKGKHYGHYDTYEDAHSAVEAVIARNHSKTAAPAQQEAGPTQIESQIEQLMQFWATDNNGWWHWTGSQADLALLNQMQQQMAAVGAPAGPPGQMQAQGFVIEANTPAPWREYLQVVASDRLVALAAWRDVVAKSKRLRSEGAVEVEVFKPEVITAYVQGDHGKYYTTVQRLGSVQGMGRQNLTSSQVSGWSCDCDWGNWAWIRKRSFVGRMCSHAYALFSEMRSLDARSRKGKGKPVGGGQSLSSVSNKAAWTRMASYFPGFNWVSDDPTAPTAAIIRTASGWSAQVWSDGTAEDSLSLGSFEHSEQARRAVSRVVTAHIKLSVPGDVDVVGGTFPPYGTPDSISGGYESPYTEAGTPEPLLPQDVEQGSRGIQDSSTRVGFSIFGADDGQDDDGPEEADTGIENEDDPSDEESLDEEVADDENNSNSDEDSDDEGVDTAGDDSDTDDIGHDEPHRRDDGDDEGTDNPGDESDDDGIEKESSFSSVAELQEKYGLTHLAGANYSLAQQDALVREGENGPGARNKLDMKLDGTHYEASGDGKAEAEDVLAFLF